MSALEQGLHRLAVFRQFVHAGQPVTANDVAQISELTGLQERSIRDYARRFQKNPVAQSLTRRPKGPKPGSHRFSDEVMTAIDRLTEEILLVKVPPSLAETARQISGLLTADEGDFRFRVDDVPSERVILRILDHIAQPTLAKRTIGSKSRSAHKPHPGEYQSGGLLDVVQMDHTRGDVILVDRVHRLALGRPWLTLLIDIWTRCILGYYVSFGDPSIFRCGRAVANALLPKGPLLAALGVDIDYPMHGSFRRLHADQAKPHRSEAFRRACISNGIDPDLRKPGPAHLGGHIERLIGTMVGKLRLLPGSTGSNVTQRDGYDAGACAAMTLPEFERWFLYQIAIYHEHPHSALGGLCPAQAWAMAAIGRPPLLPLDIDPDRLTRQFLPCHDLMVRASGIHILHRRYWHRDLTNRIGQKICVHHDERTLQDVYADLDGDFLALRVVGHYPDVTESEWEFYRAQTRDVGRAYQADGGRARTARYIFAAKREVDGAIIKTREARQARMRAEKEGISHADLRHARPLPPEPVQWKAVAELGDDDWPILR
jgi:putative transposase